MEKTFKWFFFIIVILSC